MYFLKRKEYIFSMYLKKKLFITWLTKQKSKLWPYKTFNTPQSCHALPCHGLLYVGCSSPCCPTR